MVLKRIAKSNVSRAWQARARRGIKGNGVVMFATGLAAVVLLKVPMPHPIVAFVTPAIPVLGFGYTGIQHMVALYHLDRGRPVPMCDDCDIPLRPVRWQCSLCSKGRKFRP